MSISIITDEMQKQLEIYNRMFEDGFPVFEYEGEELQFLIEIKDCIEQNKSYDELYPSKQDNTVDY